MNKLVSYVISHLFLMMSLSLHAKELTYMSASRGIFTNIHVLIIDPKEYKIESIKALTKTGCSTVKSLANERGAIAAVNGGFYHFKGHPAGILKSQGHWYGTPCKARGAIGWSSSHDKVLIDRVLTNYNLLEAPSQDAIEVIPQSNPPLTTPEEWKEVDNIVGGTPVLIARGRLIEDYSPEQTKQSFLTKKHARTAIGITASGEWVFVVVDAFASGYMGGITIKNLAQLMLKLGCVEALNLDGGGSSTIVVNGVLMNKPNSRIYRYLNPSRSVSDIIAVFPRPIELEY